MRGYVHIHAPFLATAELKQASLCSFGLTKRFPEQRSLARSGKASGIRIFSSKRVPMGHVYMKPHASLVEAQLGDSRTYHPI